MTKLFRLAIAIWAVGPTTGMAAVAIDHKPVACVVAERFPVFDAQLTPADTVGRARVYFRPTGGALWYFVVMDPATGHFRGVLPKPKKSLESLDYYLEVTDQALGTSRTPDQTAEVVSGPGACRDKLVATALSSAAPKVSGPAGAASAPIVPAGFSAASVVAAGGNVAGASGTAVAGGAGVSKALLIGGAAAAVGVGVVAAGGGGSDTPGSGPSGQASDSDGDGFTVAQGDCNDGNRSVNPSGAVAASLRSTSAPTSVRCGQASPPVTVSISNLSCQTVTAIDLGRGDPSGFCTFPNVRLSPISPTVAPGETRDVGGFGGGTATYCPGGFVRSPYTCQDSIAVTVQSSAGSLQAGSTSFTVQFDSACAPCGG